MSYVIRAVLRSNSLELLVPVIIAVALFAPTSLFLEKKTISPIAYAVTDELAVVDLAFDQGITRNGHRNRSLACSVGHH